MPNLSVLCRNLTTFSKTKELDEEAFRAFLQRMVDSKIGVYIASGGSGEGHALSRDELLRVYKIGVEVCKGKVPVNANLPDQMTAQATIEHAKLAIEARVDLINVYGPCSYHGYRATEDETRAYFVDVLSVVKHPVALAPNVMVPTPKAALVAGIANRFPQVMAINMQGQDDTYFINLKDMIERDVAINVPFGLLHAPLLGANAVVSNECSILPKTFRSYADLFNARDFDAMARVYADIRRFGDYVAKWQGPVWKKMALRVFNLPGGEVRSPYLMPSDDEIQRFGEGLRQLHIPEIDELVQAASPRAA
jgi:4-hydroxy-tetrahydrodipicolinate synthase